MKTVTLLEQPDAKSPASRVSGSRRLAGVKKEQRDE